MEAVTMEQMLGVFGQFGAAGLIGLMWLVERRQSMLRNRQLDEAHERLAQQREALETMVKVVRDNTRAITALERGQRRLVRVWGERGRDATSKA